MMTRSDKRKGLLAQMSLVKCPVFIDDTDFTLIHFNNPLTYHQPICLRVQGISPNSIIKLLASYYTAAELEACNREGTMPDEEEYTAEAVHSIMTALGLITPDAKCSLYAVPHIVYTEMSGFTVHTAYPDEEKLFPQTVITVVSEGVTILEEYANLILVPNQPEGK